MQIVGGTNQMLGNVVYDNIGAANNLPFAAAVATSRSRSCWSTWPLVRRTGALENL